MIYVIQQNHNMAQILYLKIEKKNLLKKIEQYVKKIVYLLNITIIPKKQNAYVTSRNPNFLYGI